MSNAVGIKRLKKEDETIYYISVDGNKIEVNAEKAEFLCRLLSNWLNLEVVKKHQLKRFDEALRPNAEYLGSVIS